jgi:hypothetical protein
VTYRVSQNHVVEFRRSSHRKDSTFLELNAKPLNVCIVKARSICRLFAIILPDLCRRTDDGENVRSLLLRTKTQIMHSTEETFIERRDTAPLEEIIAAHYRDDPLQSSWQHFDKVSVGKAPPTWRL